MDVFQGAMLNVFQQYDRQIASRKEREALHWGVGISQDLAGLELQGTEITGGGGVRHHLHNRPDTNFITPPQTIT